MSKTIERSRAQQPATDSQIAQRWSGSSRFQLKVELATNSSTLRGGPCFMMRITPPRVLRFSEAKLQARGVGASFSKGNSGLHAVGVPFPNENGTPTACSPVFPQEIARPRRGHLVSLSEFRFTRGGSTFLERKSVVHAAEVDIRKENGAPTARCPVCGNKNPLPRVETCLLNRNAAETPFFQPTIEALRLGGYPNLGNYE